MGQIGREKRYKRKGEREKSVKKFLKQLSNVLLSVIGFFIICILAYFILTTSTEKASWYTEEEHIERVSERVQEQIKDWSYADGKKYEGYELYPLYNEKEELKYFLIEFEPYGFVFVRILDDANLGIISCSGSRSLYQKSTKYEEENLWSPYTVDETLPPEYKDKDMQWILDENGERIEYNRSPYYVTGNAEERKYLFSRSSGEYICAVKSGDCYLNLIGGNTIDISAGDLLKAQPSLYLAFHVTGRDDL